MRPSPAFSNLVEQALSRITLAQIAVPAKAESIRESLEQWRRQSAEHDAAYQEAVRQSGALEALVPALRERFEKPPRRRGRTGGSLLSFALAGLAVAALVLGFGQWRDRQPVFHERLATAIGQQATLELPDGGHIELGAKSSVEVTYFRGRREVSFGHGEARFTVAHDAGRPFSVQTREGSVEVVGTVFDVLDRGGPVAVTLESGKVLFRPARDPAATVVLRPGERLISRQGIIGAVVPASPVASTAWRRGWLVFDNEPLADALPRINAYRRTPIRADDPVVLALRLTGSFRVSESDQLLSVLPQILPVEVHPAADGSIRLASRP